MSEAVNERSGVLMSIRGVTKAFGSNVVLKGINMDVKKGEVIALIGGNGARQEHPDEDHHGHL